MHFKFRLAKIHTASYYREMLVKDRIYGKYEIEEPVLLDLLNSKELQRLKKIAQYGMPEEYYSFLPGFNRFEHSVGVALLLKKLNASLEEQVAGLIHDVSHAAFSHVADLVFGKETNEDYQDSIHLDFLLKSNIKDILTEHGFEIDKVANFDNFKLLDREIPFLCVDRIDYALREFKLWAEPGIVNDCLENFLVTQDSRIVFTDSKTAKNFAISYLKCQREHWGSFEAVWRYHVLSQVLKESLDKGILTEEDFLEDDESVLRKIYLNENENLIGKLEEMKRIGNHKSMGLVKKKKFRYVDPEVLIGEEVKRLSEIDKDFVKILEEQKNLNKKGVKI